MKHHDEGLALYQVPFYKDKPPEPRHSRPAPPSRWPSRSRALLLLPLALLLLVLHHFLANPTSRIAADIAAAEASHWSRFAYSVYATTPAYLCSALMSLEALHRLGARADRLLLYNDEWALTPNAAVGRMLVRAMDEYGAVLRPVKVVRHGGDGTWAESLTKLRAWEQVQYARVLSLDSDGVVLKAMDELFALPPAPLAAPRAYWLEREVFSSALMLLEPSKDQYLRIVQSEVGENEFDMDVLNRIYGAGVMSIPPNRYSLLTGEFRKTNHSAFLARPANGDPWDSFGKADAPDWDPKTAMETVKFLHFSDWPEVEKPWMEASKEQVQNVMSKCMAEPSLDPLTDCASLKLWQGIYSDYWKRRQEVCGV